MNGVIAGVDHCKPYGTADLIRRALRPRAGHTLPKSPLVKQLKLLARVLEREVRADGEGNYDLRRVLPHLPQIDNLATTTRDRWRCVGNSTVAAFVAQGKGALHGGLLRFGEAISREVASFDKKIGRLRRQLQQPGLGAPAKRSLNQRLGRLARERGRLVKMKGEIGRVAEAARKNELNADDLQIFADRLVQYYGRFNPRGEPGLSDGTTLRMLKEIGLSHRPELKLSRRSVRDTPRNRSRVVRLLLRKCPAGGSIMVPTRLGRTPHMMLLGKTDSGRPYLYDPAHQPPYITGPRAIRARLHSSLQPKADGSLALAFFGPLDGFWASQAGMLDKCSRDIKKILR